MPPRETAFNLQLEIANCQLSIPSRALRLAAKPKPNHSHAHKKRVVTIFQGRFLMQQTLDWLKANDSVLIDNLKRLVAIPSISTDGEHQKEINDSAALTCEQMREAGLQNVEVLRSGDSNPYAYGEWLGAPGKPTVFLYAHHDVQPINFEQDWKS